MTTTLDEAYLDALVDYEQAQYLADPPLVGAIGLIRFGKLQENPTAYPAAALLHYGDRDAPMNWVSEMISDQANQGMGIGHQLWGSYREIGTRGTLWWHRYTQELIRYKINTTDTRFTAMAEGMALAWWLARKIQAATNTVLGLATYGNQSFQEALVTQVRPHEGGGPGNYIWKIVLRIQAQVYHAD